MSLPPQWPLPRASIAVLAGLSTWSCFLGDSQLGPDVRVARLSIAPSFATVPAAVGAANVQSLRIIVERLDGAVVFDETTDLASGQEQVELDVEVNYTPPRETFMVEILLMNGDDVVAFRGGPQSMTVPDDEGPVEIPLTYVGIGSDAAFALIDPSVAVVREGESFTFTGRAFASDETEIPGTPIEWTSLDPTIASVPDQGSGVVHGLEAGKTQITATLLNGISATAELTVTAGPILVRSPASLTFEAEEGMSASQALQISNGGGGTLSWSVSENASWLYLEPTSGSATEETDEVTVFVDTDDLTVGTYTATIAVTGDPLAAGSPQATVVTLNVTGAPTLSIDDVSLTEGDVGTVNAVFTVSLSEVTDQTVTVAYATVDGSALARIDYMPESGQLSFEPGVSNRQIAVPIIGDFLDEGAAESFGVGLSSAVNAEITDAFGVGTIIDDDGAPMVAFASDRTGDWDIYTMNPDGSSQTNITNSPDIDEQMPTWSPDRQLIAFTSTRDGNQNIYVMDAGGGDPTPLTLDPGSDHSPRWSPDGSRIAFSSDRTGNFEIFVMDVGTPANVINVTMSPNSTEEKSTWSPDGTRIVFDSDRAGVLNRDLYVLAVDAPAVQTQLTFDSEWDSEPAWAPSGTRVAFRSNRDGDFEIYLLDVDSPGSPVPLTSSSAIEWQPTWSEDGSQILFATNRDDPGATSELYIMNADGSSQVRLTANAAYDWWPAWMN